MIKGGDFLRNDTVIVTCRESIHGKIRLARTHHFVVPGPLSYLHLLNVSGPLIGTVQVVCVWVRGKYVV